MRIKTQDLTGAALDWAVSKCEGVECDELHCPIWFTEDGPYASRVRYTPSSDWSQGGPIIERELIETGVRSDYWVATMHLEDRSIEQSGPTPLIAAMRCYVASRIGDEIDFPNELCN